MCHLTMSCILFIGIALVFTVLCEAADNIPNIPSCSPANIAAQTCRLQRDEVIKGSVFNTLSSGRKRRQVFNFTISPQLQWQPSDFPIKYKFFGTDFSDNDKAAVYAALNLIQNNTCLRFQELTESQSMTTPYIGYVKAYSCVSFIGRSTAVIPSNISLNADCLSKIGEIAHYTLHVLGLLHENQRPDSGQYIIVNTNNMNPEAANEFVMLPQGYVVTLDVPYDYTAVMHLAGKAFSNSGSDTLLTLNPLYQQTIGQRVELSFYDSKLLNLVYCQSSCASAANVPACKSPGYPDPNNCNQCKCPEGTTGALCEKLDVTTGACGGVLQATGVAQAIFSPGYLSGSAYSVPTKCIWRIESPPGSVITLQFAAKFGIYCDNNACQDWVEIRYSNDLRSAGPRFCCQSAPTASLTSTTNQTTVIFRANFAASQVSDRTGFMLMFGAVFCGNVQCLNGGVCNPTNGVCQCVAGYTGTNCQIAPTTTTTTSTTTSTTTTIATTRATTTSPCANIVCQNGATCIQGLCNCVPGYTGNTCQTPVDRCVSLNLANCGGRNVAPGNMAPPCVVNSGQYITTTCSRLSTVDQQQTVCGYVNFCWFFYQWSCWTQTVQKTVTTYYNCTQPVSDTFCCGNAYKIQSYSSSSFQCAVTGWTDWSSCNVRSDCSASIDNGNCCGGTGSCTQQRFYYGIVTSGNAQYYQITDSQSRDCGSSSPCSCSGPWWQFWRSYSCCNDGYTISGNSCVVSPNGRRNRRNRHEGGGGKDGSSEESRG